MVYNADAKLVNRTDEREARLAHSLHWDRITHFLQMAMTNLWPLSGTQDVFSGRLLYVKLWTSNSNPKLIGRWYLEYLSKSKGKLANHFTTSSLGKIYELMMLQKVGINPLLSK